MKKSMLIDAAHSEETRILVLEDNAIEDLDFESTTKDQLRGNIYLAKISRVEPSLRAAFVDYGNNRHGFLPFSEIHPNYFQIPVTDKEELIAKSISDDNIKNKNNARNGSTKYEEGEISFNETINIKQASIRRSKLYSKYKIQEVIKKRQILLIQVTKEERGNKGAALTTFISLAGRYCVLMPNSANSGGISKKIPYKSRNKMKTILNDLDITDDMSVILRTAGSERTKLEIKRDYDYLSKLWQEIKDKTMKSIAPFLIHEENNIIKRAIRDYFTNDLNEIIIEGEAGYKLGKSFMKTLIPSKTKLVKKYDKSLPIFHHYGVEKDIDLIFKSEVKLNSGGSIVISPTEALVSIDVNSGRSTMERDIEPTALKTNLEASKEIARQLRLRDLGGLIVIDFIDMNIRKNNFLVENSLKNAVKRDRAKIQIGRISTFGLLEMSRQRLRPSILEINFKNCTACDGLGLIRSIESQALQIIRNIDLVLKKEGKVLVNLEINSNVAEYILNYKSNLFSLEEGTNNKVIKVKINNELPNSKYNITSEIMQKVEEQMDSSQSEKHFTENTKESKKLKKHLSRKKDSKETDRSKNEKKVVKRKRTSKDKSKENSPSNHKKEKTLLKKVERKAKTTTRKRSTKKTDSKIIKKASKKNIKKVFNNPTNNEEVKTGWWKE
tara:strand:+ start:81 stop:2081 length:2001 start_codon:yes stop_codon:yes gene_type:complete